MATIKNNIVTEGLRGMIGNQLVFRQLRGKTVVSCKPDAPRTESELQRANRCRFRHATQYAKAAMHDPQKKQYYTHKARTLGLPNAYTAAITDYMRRPVVSNVLHKALKSKSRQVVVAASKKDFALTAVEVMLTDAQGRKLAAYAALRKDKNSREWIARLPESLPDHAHMTVTATDLPEHYFQMAVKNE